MEGYRTQDRPFAMGQARTKMTNPSDITRPTPPASPNLNLSPEPSLSKQSTTAELEDAKMYMDLNIPDLMLSSFDRAYPIAQLLLTPLPGPSSGTFVCQGQRWRADFNDFFPGGVREARQLAITLPHGPFKYHSRPFVRSNVSNHEATDWFVLGEDVLTTMRHLAALKNRLGAKIIFMYNIKFEKIKLFFIKDDRVFLQVCFEAGYPQTEGLLGLSF
ncbi:hypothetical protein DFS34DRAFT_591274 [Phlyctochytrium arcticum]|nr:hypothetical protein DFS34DRAFT_591274 [Phlyctochytrium arcticum]